MPHSLSRVHQLLGDIVEEVPAAEGEGALEEGQGQVPYRGRHPEGEGIAGPQLVKVTWGPSSGALISLVPTSSSTHPPQPTLEDLDKAHGNDE